MEDVPRHESASGGAANDASAANRAPKLLDRVRAAIRTRHYSRRTEEAYVHWIRRYVVFNGKRHPRELGASDVTAFLTSLAVQRQVAAATQNQAFSAVMFLYKEVLRQDIGVIGPPPRAKRPVHVPVVLTADEVRRVRRELNDVPWLVASLLYGAGLRLQECLELRVKDLDFERHEIPVRRGKGKRTVASCCRILYAIDCDSTSRTFAAVTRLTWRMDSAVLCCPLHSNTSCRTPRPSGAGSSFFRRLASAAIRDSGHPRGFTCTSRLYSGRLPRRRAGRG